MYFIIDVLIIAICVSHNDYTNRWFSITLSKRVSCITREQICTYTLIHDKHFDYICPITHKYLVCINTVQEELATFDRGIGSSLWLLTGVVVNKPSYLWHCTKVLIAFNRPTTYIIHNSRY